MKNLVYSFLLIFPFFISGQENQGSYDLFIKNATVVDGTGGEKFSAHVLINDDEIVVIERDTSIKFPAKKKIEASGMILSPGFIDTHAHGDPLSNPDFTNFLAMGVTTIALGQDGRSPKEKDLSGWMEKVTENGMGPNIAMFAGHNTLRELSGINFDTLPKAEDLQAMEDLLTRAMEAGAFGLTTGLEYEPGNFSTSEELERLARIVGENQGIIMSHIRNEDDREVENSIRELLRQGKYSPVHVSHIKSVYGKGAGRAEEILNLLDSARVEGIEVTADLYPYNASYTGIAIVFPQWAKKPNDYNEVVKNRKLELQEFLRNKIEQRNGPEATLIGSGKFAGKNLKEISEELHKAFEDVLIEDIGPYGAGGAYFIMDEELQETLMQRDFVNICSDGSPTMRHPRGYGSFAKIIEAYVCEQQFFSLEKAIYKMSGLPAKTIGLEERGTIKEGNKADILLFKAENIKETATYENPHQLAEGFDYVLVNGKIAKHGGGFSKDRYGEMLRKE